MRKHQGPKRRKRTGEAPARLHRWAGTPRSCETITASVAFRRMGTSCSTQPARLGTRPSSLQPICRIDRRRSLSPPAKLCHRSPLVCKPFRRVDGSRLARQLHAYSGEKATRRRTGRHYFPPMTQRATAEQRITTAATTTGATGGTAAGVATREHGPAG